MEDSGSFRLGVLGLVAGAAGTVPPAETDNARTTPELDALILFVVEEVECVEVVAVEVAAFVGAGEEAPSGFPTRCKLHCRLAGASSDGSALSSVFTC